MAIKTLKSITRVVEGVRVESEVRGHKVTMDQTLEQGGTNMGMGPMELILCGLGGCQAITAAEMARKFGIELEEFWVETEGNLERPKLEDTKIGYLEIRYSMHIKSNASEEKLNKFIEFADKYVDKSCPVSDSLAAPVKLVYTGMVVEK